MSRSAYWLAVTWLVLAMVLYGIQLLHLAHRG